MIFRGLTAGITGNDIPDKTPDRTQVQDGGRNEPNRDETAVGLARAAGLEANASVEM